MWAYKLLTILLILSLPFFPEQFVATPVRTLIVIFSFLLLPIFTGALLDDIKKKFTPTFLFLAFLIPMTIATLLSINVQESAKQLLMFYSFFIIFVAIRSVFPTLRSKELLTSCFLLLTFILSLISLYNTLVNQYVSRDALSFLWVYFGHNHLSAILVFTIPLSLYFLKTYWNNKQIRTLLLITSCLLLISLLFTFSIGSMISLAISFLVALVLFGKSISKKNFPFKKVYFAVFLIITTITVSSFYTFNEDNSLKINKLKVWKNPQAHAEQRFIYWQAAFENFQKNPLTGTGLETFNEVLPKFAEKEGIERQVTYTTHAHNFFIQMLTDTGIFGFLASICLIGSVLWELKNRLETRLPAKQVENWKLKIENSFYLSLFTALLSSTILATIDLDWHAPTVFFLFWILAGLSTNQTINKPKSIV